MKQRLQELLNKHELNEYSLTKYTGSASRSDSLASILNGDREVTSVNLNLISTFARGLGLRLTDVLDDFDLDGTTGQVLSMERKVERFRKVKAPIDIEYPNGGFIKGVNVKEDLGKFPLKKKYEFLNPKVSHEEQSTNAIYLLNNEQLNRDPKFKSSRNESLTNLSPRFNAYAWAYFIYSPLKDGGDFKTVASVFRDNGEGEFLFTEVYGCEWINREDNKSICYYKYHSDYDTVTPELINDSKKVEISELEFYRGFISQFLKFNVTPN